MSPRDDLVAQLREARPLAPAELRDHVRRIAAATGPEPRRRRLPVRRALLVAIPVAAAAAAAAVLLPRGSSPGPAVPGELAAPPAKVAAPASAAAGGSFAASGQAPRTAVVPAPSPNRVQRIGATLELRVPSTVEVSDGTKEAVAIARALGGYARSVSVDAEGRTGYARIVLRIPKANVGRAIARLAELGTIVGEDVSIQDLTAQVDATARKIARLRSRVSAWRSQPQTAETAAHIASLEAAIGKLERGRAATIAAASDATVSLELTTKPLPPAVHRGHGPLHGLAVAFRWVGIGAVYLLALGAPLLLLAVLCWLAARALRRRREDALLSGS